MSLEQRLKQGPLSVRSLWTEEQTATLPDAVAQRQRRRALRQRIALSSSVATVLIGSVVALLVNSASVPSARQASTSAVRQPIPMATPVPSAEGRSVPAPGEQLTLVDGTRVTLDRGATFDVVQQTAQAVLCDLASGAATVEVIPNRPRSFTLRAGDVTVAVIGTVFRVERSAEQTQVAVERGHVSVSWAGGSQELRAGERGTFPPSSASDSVPPSDSDEPSRAGDRSWKQLAKAGDYNAAYRAFQQQSQPLQRVEELMLAADSARLSGHATEAIPHLSRVYREFPRDVQAPLAAFTVGRILADQLGRPMQAAEAFRAARALSSSGPLAGDAMAREVECLVQAGNVNQARDVAGRYLKLFPQGRHRPQMQKLAKQD
jgi:transmembrane sensor